MTSPPSRADAPGRAPTMTTVNRYILVNVNLFLIVSPSALYTCPTSAPATPCARRPQPSCPSSPPGERHDPPFPLHHDFGFDPALLQLLGVSEGKFLSDVGPTNFIDGMVDNNAGSVSYVADSLTGAVFGRSGSGYLLDFHLLATGDGLTTLRLPNFLFLNSSFEELALVSSPVEIMIGATAVPLPGTLLLLAAGLLAAGAANVACRNPKLRTRVFI
jgi:hypothetical protein